MIRDTSREAYNKIKAEGLLSKRRWQVYDALTQYGPCTANELHARMGRTISAANVQSNLHPRLGELRDRGVVAELPKTHCTITGNQVHGWKVLSDKLPIEPKKIGRYKCPTCKGAGFLEEKQMRLL